MTYAETREEFAGTGAVVVTEPDRKKRDVLFWTGSQIADWYMKVGPKPQ